MVNITVFQKSTPHALRAISLTTFPPAFIILLIAGIQLSHVIPAIGLVPLFFSSAYSALLLANERKCGCQAGGLTGTPFHFILDFVIGTGLLVCLILAWVLMPGSWRGSGIMMGTYGTNFLICNFLIHFYFVLGHLREAMHGGQTYPMSCPQCQSGSISFSFGSFQFGKSYNFGAGTKNGYAPLLDEAGEPSASTDDRPSAGEDMV